MSGGVQRVVVIQDASRDISPIAIRWVLHGMSLKSGDALLLFGVLHQVNSPMGYKVKVDASSMFGINPKFIAEEVSRKTEEYVKNVKIMEIAKHCEMEQIDFHIEVHAGSDPKVIALKAAKNFRATWVILDRQMKKDKKYFMERIPCGISRMKRNNTIEKLRGPKTRENKKVTAERRVQFHSRGEEKVPYDEMIPGSPKRGSSIRKPPVAPKTSSVREEQSDRGEDFIHQNYRRSASSSKSPPCNQFMMTTASTSSLGYHEASSSAFKTAKHAFMNFQEEENTGNAEQETAGEQSLASNTEFQQREKQAYDTVSPNEQQESIEDWNWMGGSPSDEVFRNSICSVCKNRRPKIGWKRDFSYAELHAATEGFSETKFLSEGGFGSVYRGDMNGLKIAVKQHKNASFQGEKEFKSEVQVLSKARHENLVMLLGSCSEGNDRLLVYEYVCNGSLDQHLSKHARKPLSWGKRVKIALGAARGLQYLHENNIIHRDMRPNNILITHDHEALLGDFGLARTQHEDSEHSLETRVVGTLGYLAPEYAECGKVSTKTDVYSFGVVLLQLITGLKTTDKILGGRSLVGWARPLLKDRNYPDLIDQRILGSHDVHQLFWSVRVAEKCLSKDPQKRLTMDKVVYALNYIIDSNTTYSLGDLTPERSDSPSSSRYSNESQEDDDTSFTEETTSTCFTTETTSTCFTTETMSSSSTSLRLPPSPPVNTQHRLQ